MSGRWLMVAGATTWLGATLLLSHVRWFARGGLTERLRPYVAGGSAGPGGGALSVESFRDAIGPVARMVGEHVGRLVGVSEDVDVRLRRIHSPLDVTSFRVRQVGWAVGGLGAGALAALALRPAAPVALAFVLGAPALAFLAQEQLLASASARWQRSVFLELPVVAEQLSMLVGAGWSLTAALNRIATRGAGSTAVDLRRVCQRVRHGVDEAEALREWADVVKVPAVTRLVAVLSLNRDTSDLARLVAHEARAVRRDAHRELIELAERRDQQVWIPVTVATLVPGILFLTIPFVEALRLFGG